MNLVASVGRLDELGRGVLLVLEVVGIPELRRLFLVFVSGLGWGSVGFNIEGNVTVLPTRTLGL